MKAFVTGASGFIGSNLVHELVARGHQVKALLRPESDERGLAGVEFTRVTGDVFDRELLEREMEGCDWCFHVAASYHLWLRNYRPMYAVNVEGTRRVLEAAGRAGCQRIVYTSTVGCVGLPKMADGRLLPSTELDVISPEHLTNHYKCSKWQAECVAAKLARNGLPIVIVNPTAPIGPRDVKPTPTGQVIVDFLNRKLPAYLDTGLNWVHVRDVAAGHILAAEKGGSGRTLHFGQRRGQLDHAGNPGRAGGNHRRARAEVGNSLLGGARGGAREPMHLRISPAKRPGRRWRACAWPNTKCGSVRPGRFGCSSCHRRRRDRRSLTPSSGFARTGT